MRSASRWLIPYILSVDLAALTLLLTTLQGLPPQLWPLCAFVPLAVLAELWTVAMPRRIEISLSFPVYFAAAVLFGPGFGILTAVTSTLIADGLVRRKGTMKTAFSAGELAICSALTGLTFAALTVPGDFGLTSAAPAYLGAGAAYVLVNTTLAAAAFSLTGQPFGRTWTTALRETGMYLIAMALLGTLVADAYSRSPWALLYFPVLMWVLYQGFRLYARLGVETNNALIVLADTIEKRDRYTFEHSVRVARYAGQIAARLGLPPEETGVIVTAAKVHDLGKISIDNRILLKEGPITEEERQQIRGHPAAGEKLAGQFGLFGEGAAIIRHHHERWDGAGYPDGLAGEDIPLGARIIAVADVYDAMTSDRPYRTALSHDVAVSALIEGRGTQFDGRIVEAFLASEEAAPLVVPSATALRA